MFVIDVAAATQLFRSAISCNNGLGGYAARNQSGHQRAMLDIMDYSIYGELGGLSPEINEIKCRVTISSTKLP